ncbi:unnamed protein product, partial [Arabidopsis halleri]
MWIYGTVSEQLLDTILKAKSTARDLWLTLENLFRDNKEAQSIQYDNELRTLVIGDMSVTNYAHKLKTLADLMANVDAPVTDRTLVMHMLNGLSDKFDSIINVIQHQTPFLSFIKARLMLIMEEKRLSKQVKTIPEHNTNSSSPTIMYTDLDPQQQRSQNYNNNNSGRNNNNSGYNKNRGGHGGRNNRGRGRSNNQWNNNTYPASPWSFNQAPWVFPNAYNPPPAFAPPPYYAPHVPSYPSQSQPHVGQQGPFQPRQQGEAHYIQGSPLPPTVGGYPAFIHSALPQAFTTMNLQDPASNLWVLDSGATDHIATQPGTLRSLFNKSTFPSITVGNGSSAHITHTGHTIIPSSTRPLHLRNVLVCPDIIKNLVSVRKFVTDNSCTVEFDTFCFCVKDLQTRRKILRCDSPRPLYTITPPAPTPLAFTASAPFGTLWHRRLGHPGINTLNSLATSGFIHLNKTDMTTLCHACQLGKHVRLPFHSSNSRAFKSFDLIHSDLWTSPVSSISGINYYVIFLDDCSHFVWVYHLRRKSDTFSGYLHFAAMVRTDFIEKYHSFNVTMGRMLRTLNNLVRTLLVQANMSSSYWVEALNTAVHILIILPSAAINNEVPFTKLFSRVPRYDQLRVFGSLCYPNLLPTTPHKLAPRSTACVFLGYPSNHSSYWCLDINTKKIILSRHVVFGENVFPFAHQPAVSIPDPIPPPLPPISRLTSTIPTPVPPAPPSSPVLAQPPSTNTHPMMTHSKHGI